MDPTSWMLRKSRMMDRDFSAVIHLGRLPPEPGATEFDRLTQLLLSHLLYIKSSWTDKHTRVGNTRTISHLVYADVADKGLGVS